MLNFWCIWCILKILRLHFDFFTPLVLYNRKMGFAGFILRSFWKWASVVLLVCPCGETNPRQQHGENSRRCSILMWHATRSAPMSQTGEGGSIFFREAKLFTTQVEVLDRKSRPSKTESVYVQALPDRKCLCPDFRAFKIAYVQTIVRSKSHMSRLSCVQKTLSPDYRAFIFFQTV